MRRRGWLHALALLASAGCGDDGVGTTAGSDTDPSTTGATATSPTTSISESVTETDSGTGTESGSADTDVNPDTGSSGGSSGGPNEPPEAVDDQYLVFLSEMPLLVDGAAGVLANDMDPDGNPLSVVAFDNPSSLGLEVQVDDDGAFTYDFGAPWWGGPDAFGYTISDGRGGEASASVDLLVVPNLVPLGQVRSGVGRFAIDGEGDGDAAGYAVAVAGDVDNDGLADVVVGAPGLGRAYVVFGKADGTSVDLGDIANGSGGGFAILAEAPGDNVGYAVGAAGDVNDDGLADVIVSSPESDAAAANAGRTYVVFGRASTTPVNLTDVAGGTGGFALDGQTNANRSGDAVTGVGNLDGDGFDDVAIGAAQADPNGGDSGRIYVVFGKADGNLVALADVWAGTGGFAIEGELAGDAAGRAVAGVGDVNGDLVPDILVGAPLHDGAGGGAGRCYVVHGKSDGALVPLSNVAAGLGGFALDGEASGDWAGLAVGPIGDLDGDDLADFAIASPHNDAGGTDTGRVYVVFGREDGTLVDLADVAAGTGGWVVDALGTGLMNLAVSGGGDVDGDGLPDIAVGAIPPNAGRSYLVHGKIDGEAVDPADLAQGMGGFAMDGEQNSDGAGFSVGMGGDVNGDGFGDVVLGAWGFPSGAARGRTYVVFGSPTSFD